MRDADMDKLVPAAKPRKDKSERKLVKPVPEAIDGQEWEVTGSPKEGHTDSARKRMTVPVLDTPVDQYIRNHEMAHAKWSPEKKPRVEGVDDLQLQCVEDMRMNRLLKTAGIDTMVDVTEGSESAIEKYKAIKDEDISFGAGQLMASMGTKLFGRLKGAANTREKEIARMVKNELLSAHPDKPTFDDTVRAAKLFAELVAQAEEDESQEQSNDGEEGDGNMDEVLNYFGFGDEESIEEEESEAEDNLKPTDEGRTLVWGKCEIVREEMPIVHAPKLEGIKKIATDTGVVPTNMSRYCTDMKIFNHKRKKDGGGSVVIDCSGSMHLTAGEIKEYLKKYPAATIGLYGASNTHGLGYVVIIAENGRMIDTDRLGEIQRERFSGGNLVDGPALDWLAKQGKTRVWVSDGYVTGMSPGSGYYGEGTARNLVIDCANKCKKYGITRVLGLDDATAIEVKPR